MLFALIVLESAVAHDSLIFKIAAFVILCSIVAHGLTDTVGARWIERHVGAADDADLVGRGTGPDLGGRELFDHRARGVVVDLGLLGVEGDRLVDPAEQDELLDLGRGLGILG